MGKNAMIIYDIHCFKFKSRMHLVFFYTALKSKSSSLLDFYASQIIKPVA